MDRADGPNIYVILLHGYPRRDVLERYLDFDNSEFEESLTALGFDVATDSRSNFSATWATLASMFHGAYLHDIDSLNPFSDRPLDRRSCSPTS